MDLMYIICLVVGIHIGQEYKNFPNIKKTSLYLLDKYKEHVEKH